jgi:hypothetical protein
MDFIGILTKLPEVFRMFSGLTQGSARIAVQTRTNDIDWGRIHRSMPTIRRIQVIAFEQGESFANPGVSLAVQSATLAVKC